MPDYEAVRFRSKWTNTCTGCPYRIRQGHTAVRSSKGGLWQVSCWEREVLSGNQEQRGTP